MLRPGDEIAGRYIIIAVLGSGGMGTVYLAKDKLENNHLCAIKTIRSELVRDKRRANQLRDEAIKSKKLGHPNIVKVHRYDEWQDTPYLIMEYIDGITLEDLLADKYKLSAIESLFLFEGLCLGLNHAHKCGIIHRDIKPANILIDKNNTPKLVDFGIAIVAKESTYQKQSGYLPRGSLVYMSPEYLRGEIPSIRSDIYSLGIVFYEILNGEAPFIRGDIYRQHQEVTPKPISGIPDPLNYAILWALKKSPEKRPISAIHFLEQICEKKNHIENIHQTVDSSFSSDNFELRNETDLKLNDKLSYYEMYRKAHAGDPIAQYELGSIYYDGRGAEEDHEEGLKWLMKSAKLGYVEAQFTLGAYYNENNNISEAIKWYTSAAQQKHTNACFVLANIYEEGKVLKKNLKEAFKLYQIAAEKGNDYASCSLGYMYLDGIFVKKNEEKAAELFRAAAEKGNSIGQFMLGEMYEYGKGEYQNYNEALKWYKLAAENGNARAMTNIGYMHEKGLVGPSDSSKAFEWYMKGASHGDAFGQNKVGDAYYEGKVVERNLDLAEHWFKLGLKNSPNKLIYKTAKLMLKIIREEKNRSKSIIRRIFK